MKRFLTRFFLIAAALFLSSASSPPPTPASPETQAELSTALSLRLRTASPTKLLAANLFTPEIDAAFTSDDGKLAVLWLTLHDDTGRRLATEPGLALARLTDQGWQVLLPGDRGWDETQAALPAGMLPQELSPAPKEQTKNSIAASALTGYYLPYAAGTSHFLEGSISHFQSIPELGYPSCAQEYCQYAYDLTDADHFPLLAAKDGSVVASRDSCTDGNTGCTNYMVLYNASDDAYQIYLHMSHATIPDKLTPGTAVKRGQYLGDTDDTGYSTSNHVHFMVTKSVWVGGDGYYWGYSIDVRFADVPINNGIPRTCYEVTHFPIYDGATQCNGNKSDPLNPANDWFVSGNVGAYPPTGSLSRPASGATVASGSNPLIDVTATVNDDVRVTAVRLVAKINNQWVEIGPQITQPAQPGLYDWDVNLCDVGPLNGPLQVALRAWDHEGNVAPALDPRTIQVDHACPPPASQLNPAEVSNSTAVRLSWDGASAGAGLSAYDLQWRNEPGAWSDANTLHFASNQRSTWFVGQLGGAYAFRLRALDTNGQPEPWPANDAYETLANLPSTCSPDTSEPDDLSTQAKALTLGQWAQRNLCGSGNPDWFSLNLPDPGEYMITALSKNGGAAVKVSIFWNDGTTVLAQGQASGVGENTVLLFRPGSTGIYYLKVEPLVANLAGTDAVYWIMTIKTRNIYLPLVAR